MATNAWNESVEVLTKATTAPKAAPVPPTGKTSDPVADWGLNRSLSLKARCADFYLSTGGGYGGPPWAGIAETLWRYEVGIYSPTTFIDTCWGQQHNGGSFFNKVWSPSGLQTVLDAKQIGDAAYLATLATDETRTAYEQFEKGEL
jgi:hypothetical protein